MAKVIIKNGVTDREFFVEVAESAEERQKGLMFRDFLEETHGMFFIFEKSQVVNFWMKNTKISLDMIFIDENFKIVHIEEHANPCDTKECALYSSELPIKFVLEINAGLVQKYGIADGNDVVFEP